MTKRYALLFLVLLFAACKRDRKDLLTRKWQETGSENPQLEEVMQSQQAFIDTMGQHTTPAQNAEIYGASDIDSFKQSLQANLDSFRKMQERNVAATQFDFRENGILYMHTELGTDSVAWKLDEDGTTLLLDGQKTNGAGPQLQMEIVRLSDTELKLKYAEQNSFRSATFAPVKK